MRGQGAQVDHVEIRAVGDGFAARDHQRAKAVVDLEQVRIGAARQGVGTRARRKGIGPGAARQTVIASAARQAVITRAAVQRIRPGAAGQRVIAARRLHIHPFGRGRGVDGITLPGQDQTFDAVKADGVTALGGGSRLVPGPDNRGGQGKGAEVDGI